MIWIYPGERVDDLQNGLYVIQNPEKFCFGMDAVLLSGFADIRQNEKVLDMGTGTGIIPFLLKAKDKGSHLTGLEIQEECADMARRSVSYNHLEADIDIVCGDIKEAAEIFGAASFPCSDKQSALYDRTAWPAEPIHGKSNCKT